MAGRAVVAIRFTCPDCEANLILLIRHPEHCPGCGALYVAKGKVVTRPKVFDISVNKIDHDPGIPGFDAIRLEDIDNAAR